VNKEKKINLISLIKEIFVNNSAIILIEYKGLNAKNMYCLRKSLKSKNASIKVFKNTLTKKAIDDNSGKNLISDFKNQVAISYSNDPVSLSSVLTKFMKDNENVSIKAGLLDGNVVTLDTIKSMSSLGSMEEVRSKFIGLLKAPCSQFVRIFSAYETKLNENAK
jgi:large subunit ribosomal protein L10